MQNYKILDQVGEGTYGRVFKAVYIRNNETVAIKQLFSMGEEEGVSYLALQEIKFLKLLNECKHIVKLLDVFTDRDPNKSTTDSLCLVFQYASADLTGLLSISSYTPPLSHVKCLFKQLLEGLNEIHKRYLMHRDIKAANLLIHDGHLQLGDLGMMTNFKQKSDFPPNVVTLWYRAPELLLGANKYGPEVDMWSAGVVFVELMTKKSPFPGHSEAHQMDLIFKVLGTPDSSAWPGVDQLPGFKTLRKGLYKTNQLRRIFKDWDNEALDLLEQLLAPPHKRITAEQALQHPFFKAEPVACEPVELARLPSIHEFEVKGKKRPNNTHHNQQTQHTSYYNNNNTMEQTKKRNLYAPPQNNNSFNSNNNPQCTYPSHEPNKQMRYNNMAHPQQPYHHSQHHHNNNNYQKYNNNNYQYNNQSYDSHSHSHKSNINNSHPNYVFIPPQRDTDNLHLYRNGGVEADFMDNNNSSRNSGSNNTNRLNVPQQQQQQQQQQQRKVVVPHKHSTTQPPPESPARPHSVSPQNVSPPPQTHTQQTQTPLAPQLAAVN